MIILYQFPSVWGLPNASTFCMKLETFLRMNGLSYEVKHIMNPAHGPKGKVPFVDIDGHLMGDSELIIDYLRQTYNIVSDNHLSDQQWALMQCIDALLSDRLYWILLYYRWQVDAGWLETKKSFFGRLPALLQWAIPAMVRKKTVRALYLHGFGRHAQSEIAVLADKALHALSVILGNNAYFTGGKAVSIDASIFAHLANIAWTPYDNELTHIMRKYTNLLSYCERMWDLYFSEMKKPFALCIDES